MKNSEELAAKVLRAQKVADYVRQISEVEFCMDQRDLESIFIGTKTKFVNNPIIKVDFKNVPSDIVEEIGLESVCEILNKHLENAKTEIMTIIQDVIFSGTEIGNEEVSEPEDDGFMEIN